MFNRKRTKKFDANGNEIKGIFIKNEYADRIGFALIKRTLPGLSNMRLLKAKGVYDSSPETSFKPLFKDLLIKEFKKRGIEWIELNDPNKPKNTV